MARLFISADQMDRWTGEGKVHLEDDVMTLPALGRSFQLRTAVRFLSVVEGADMHGLLGRVKTADQLAEMGSDGLSGVSPSVEIDTGYERADGFGGGSRVAMSYGAHPGLIGANGAAGLEVLRVQSGQQMALGENVERGGRLIENQDLRVEQQGDGKQRALAHAAAQLMRISVENTLRVELYKLEQFQEALAYRLAVVPTVSACRVQDLIPDA